jgi:small redox-active disulfide protein 2
MEIKMKTLKIYGSGCKNCINTAELITQTAKQRSLEITLEKITDLEAIMEAGVMSTPAVAVDGKIVHSGSVPNQDEVNAFLS